MRYSALLAGELQRHACDDTKTEEEKEEARRCWCEWCWHADDRRIHSSALKVTLKSRRFGDNWEFGSGIYQDQHCKAFGKIKNLSKIDGRKVCRI